MKPLILPPACRTICYRLLLNLLPALLLFAGVASAADSRFSVLVTSNLQGNFSPEVDRQETTDPLLILAQNILADRARGAELFLDLGNALYPGVLAKYSSGSIMVDFLEQFSCAAVLVSSKDLQIGTRNLELMQHNRQLRFLSANIVQDGKTIFASWFAAELAGTRVAVLGISSKNIRFDVPEKELYGYGLVEEKEAIAPQLADIRTAGIDHVVLLSGQGLKETAEILDTYPEIDIALCGGDFTDRLLGGKASRIELVDGRSIVMAGPDLSYYHLDLAVTDGKLTVQNFAPAAVSPQAVTSSRYRDFVGRLTLWKEQFREDEQQLVTRLDRAEAPAVDDLQFGQLLRDRFNCELGIVEENTINRRPVPQAVNRSDFLAMVNRDYNIFLLSLSGAEIAAILQQNERLVIAGLETAPALAIQGRTVGEGRRYRAAATQLAMQKIQRLLGRPLDYTNTWLTVTDLLTEDLKSKRVVLRDDFDYLDRRFRTTIDTRLANFIDNSHVRKSENIEVPPGQPSQDYSKWGLEDSVDIAFYNRYHLFVISPYLFYAKQDDSYLNNVLRGTLLYEYNLSETYRPYNKFRYDTVLQEVDGQRPSFLRETLGLAATYGYVTGKLGVGFEQQVRDPAEPALYGVELIVGVQIPFLSYFTYSFAFDTFTGILDDDIGQWQSRNEINNTVSAALNSYLSLSFRHKFFYFSEEASGQSYQNSQFITSLDFRSDWKFW